MVALYQSVLISSIIFIVLGIFLTAFSLFSPLWQVATIPSLYITHQHGLWWDCTEPIESPEKIIPLRQIREQEPREKCVSKFDPTLQDLLRSALQSTEPASKELLLHRFLPHHKAVIFFSVFTFLFGSIGIIIGACSPCFPPNSLLYVVAMFMTSACSVLADIIFIFAAHNEENSSRIEEKSIEQGGIGPFTHSLGLACYMHILASLLFIFALFLSILSSYLLISTNKGRSNGCCISKSEYIQQNRSWRTSSTDCDRKICRPFVVVDDESL